MLEIHEKSNCNINEIFGLNMKMNHLGIIVSDIKKNIALYMNIGYVLKCNVLDDRIQHNRIAIMKSVLSPDIELIEPLDENSTVYNFKEGYHHICYEAETGEDIVSKFKAMNIGKIFTSPIIAPALDGKKVVFACLRNGTFIELIM